MEELHRVCWVPGPLCARPSARLCRVRAGEAPLPLYFTLLRHPADACLPPLGRRVRNAICHSGAVEGSCLPCWRLLQRHWAHSAKKRRATAEGYWLCQGGVSLPHTSTHLMHLGPPMPQMGKRTVMQPSDRMSARPGNPPDMCCGMKG